MSGAISAAIIVLVIFFILMLISMFNSLVTLKKNVDMAWANIDVALKQRFDEIPQIVDLVSQYVAYEKDLFQKIIDLREKYITASSSQAKMETSNEFSQALNRIFLYSEHNPELKANASFLQLQKRVSDLEETLTDRREFLNSTITVYNSKIAQFPEMLFANLLGYKETALFRPQEFEFEKPSLKIKTN